MRLIFRLIKLSILLIILALVFHNFTARMLLTLGLRLFLGTPVSVENVRVSLLDTQIKFDGVRIGNPGGFPEGTLANIRKLYFDLETSSLWEGRLHFDTVEIDCPDLRVVRAPDGKVNLLSLNFLKGSKSEADRRTPPEPSARGLIRIENFILTLGYVTYTDLHSSSPIQKSFHLRLNHAVYREVGAFGDMVRIIVWETMKRLGIGQLEGVLDQLREKVPTLKEQKKGLLEKAKQIMGG